MKNRIAIPLCLATSMLVLSGITGCRPDDDDTDLISSNESAFGEQAFSDLHDMANEAARGQLESFKTDDFAAIVSGCATITHDTVSVPRVLTIDFGTGCTGNDGRVRRGKVIVTYNGPYAEPGHLHTITTEDYFVNDRNIIGTKTVLNEGLNSTGNIYYSITVDAQIINPDGTTIDWNGQGTREWIEGVSTPQRSDDVYLISGSRSAQKSDGRGFTAQTLEPLRKARACSWIMAGVLEFTPNNRPTATIDFGDGQCDNQAVVTRNGNSFNITLN